MPKLNITIKYKDDSCDLSVSSNDKVREIINRIVKDREYPDFADGEVVTYRLYIRDEKGEQPLNDDSPIGERCKSGDVLYLAGKNDLWWNKSNNTGQGSPPPSPSPTPEPREELEPREEFACQLRIHNGRTLTLRRGESLLINRSFILSNLSVEEQMRIRLGLDDNIERVSRDKHCKIYTQGDVWCVKAYRTVYVNGRRYRDHQAVSLPKKTTLTIGRLGWRIEVELLPK